MEQRWEHLFELLGAFLPKLLLAAVLFAAGYGIIRLLLRMLRKGLGRSRHIDPAIHPFILTVSKMVLMVLLVLVCLDAIAVPVTPLITALGAVGVAVSLALKDSLANLLGGSLLLVSKPFKIGDYCSINGEEGSIAEVGFVYTALNTTDNRRVFIPNGQVITATVINYNSGGTRCLEQRFNIDYSADFEAARAAILRVVEADPLALRQPAPLVRMSAHLDSSIELISRVWVRCENYRELSYNILEGVKREFDRLGIGIPYPQMDVHLKND